MALYSYLKEEKTITKRAVNYFSYLTLTLGSLLLFWAFYPIVSFEIYSRLFIQNKIIAPVPQGESTSSMTLASSVLGSYSGYSNNLRDFTQASLWFPSKTSVKNQTRVNISQYYLSIPKLNIQKAIVKTSGDDLTKSLIHFVPTSLPGEYGNVAIFGHSTLPQLYDTKDYKTLFTYLPSLQKGDKININMNGVDYSYEVYEMFVVKPEQVSVLDQKYDASYLTLVTCVPPGTVYERLIVRARLTKLPENF